MSDTGSNPSRCQKCGAPLIGDAVGGLCPHCLLAMNLATKTEVPGETGSHGTRVISPPPPPAEIAALFPQLEILECLGHGGMGVVYKARQPKLNRLVALKLLARDREKGPQFAERFTREAQALARLSHQNIVTVYDFGETGGHCYLLMEFVDGLSLRQMLQSRKLAPEEALAIVPRICEALQYAHDQGIVHRDIKPENILLDKQGRVKIADFGIAKIVGQPSKEPSLTGAKDVVGTPHYMAPEQIEHPLKVDHRADIYSLGVVFYEMLTGELPLGKFAAPSKMVQVDVRLDEVVLHTLEKEPERRYQQASQVKTAVETIATSPSFSSSERGPLPSEAQGRLTSAGKTPPRFSLAAIAGAILAPFGVVLLIPLLLLLVAAFSPAGVPQPGRASFVVLPFALLGLAAPFGTTILGWIAVSQIRRSAGKIHGMWLAVFDGLLFPLIVLTGTVTWFWWWFFHKSGVHMLIYVSGETLQSGQAKLIGLSLIAAVVTAVIACWLIIRGVWRAVNKPVEAMITGAAPTAPSKSRPDRFWRRFAAAVALVLLAMILILVGSAIVTTVVPRFVKAWNRQPDSTKVSWDTAFTEACQVIESRENWPATPEDVVKTFWQCRAAKNYAELEVLWPGSASWTPSWPQICERDAKVTYVFGRFDALHFTVPYASKSHFEATGSYNLHMGLAVLRTRAGLRYYVVDGNVAVPQSKLATSAAKLPGFGPVIERVLNDLDDRHGSEALDLRTGQVSSIPAEVFNNPEVWFKTNQMNLLVERVDNRWGFMVKEVRLAEIADQRWEDIQPEDARRSLASGRSGLEVLERNGHRFYLLAEGAKPPLMVAFQTDAGDWGLLQITGFTDDPRGVKMRYKLVQLAAVQTAEDQSATNGLMLVIHDNMGLDLDTGTLRTVRRETDTNLLSTLDIGWDNDGGGALMKNPMGAAKILALPDVQNFGQAIAQARSRVSLVRTSDERGSFASQCRFFAVLTDRGRLAVVEVIDPSETQATIYWRLLSTPEQQVSSPLEPSATSTLFDGCGLPFPTLEVVAGWSVEKRILPNPLVALDAWRKTENYGDWLGKRDIRTFTYTNSAGYQFEIKALALARSEGHLSETLAAFGLRRPDGTVLAYVPRGGSGDWTKWTYDVYGDDGQTVSARVSAAVDNRGKALISGVVWNPETAKKVEWMVNPLGVAYAELAWSDKEKKWEQTQFVRELGHAPYRKAETTTAAFGPVIERVIQSVNNGTNCFLDLDTGEFRTPPPEMRAALVRSPWQFLYRTPEAQRMQNWIRTESVDLMAGTPPDQLACFNAWAAVIPGMPAFGATNQAPWTFDNFPLDRLMTVIQSLEQTRQAVTQQARIAGDSRPVFSFLRPKEDLTETYAILTDEGRAGILQISGFPQNPQGVRIRYSLVRDSQPQSGTTPPTNRRLMAVASSAGTWSPQSGTTPTTNQRNRDKMEVTVDREGLVVRSLSNDVWQASVIFRNGDSNATPVFSLLFYAGPAQANGRPISWNLVGPIPPGGTFSASTACFGLRDGETNIVAVVDPENSLRRPAQSNEWILNALAVPGQFGSDPRQTFGPDANETER